MRTVIVQKHKQRLTGANHLYDISVTRQLGGSDA